MSPVKNARHRVLDAGGDAVGLVAGVDRPR